MYSLDVNFLNDRSDIRPTTGPKPSPRPVGERTPLFIGLAVGLLLPGLVGGLWFFLQQQNANLNKNLEQLNAEIKREQIEQQKIKDLNDKTAQVRSETAALASVFNQIKPWSALMQDIRERTPSGIQITSIEQKNITAKSTPTPAASPAPKAKGANAKETNSKGTNAKAADAKAPSPPPVASNLVINGTARSFDEVNYFLLTLQRSPFFKSEDTQIVQAQLISNSTKLEVPDVKSKSATTAKVTYLLPKVVSYTIQTSLNDIPASELVRELDRKGAVGLVTRIRTLQEKGVNQP